jgi:hypothetical protein
MNNDNHIREEREFNSWLLLTSKWTLGYNHTRTLIEQFSDYQLFQKFSAPQGQLRQYFTYCDYIRARSRSHFAVPQFP